jgi:hypothetical protein
MTLRVEWMWEDPLKMHLFAAAVESCHGRSSAHGVGQP